MPQTQTGSHHNSQTVPIASSVPATTTHPSSKKSKKKKSKGKGLAANDQQTSLPHLLSPGSLSNGGDDGIAGVLDYLEDTDYVYDGDEFLDDLDSLPLPSLDLLNPLHGGAIPPFPGGLGMQAPPLVSQHHSDPLSAYEQHSLTFPNLNLSHQDLLNTANELYRRMEDPQFASDDAYWTSLPVHLRNFIRNALPLAGGVAGIGNGSGILPGGAAAAGGQRAMYHLAQQVVNAANQGLGGLGQPPGQGGMPGLMDPAGAPMLGGLTMPMPTDHGMPGALPVRGSDGYFVDESDNGSEDSVNNLAMDSLSISNAAEGGDAAGKKKKKKKKKGTQEPSQILDAIPPAPPVQPIPAPPLAKPVSQPPPTQPPPAPQQQQPKPVPVAPPAVANKPPTPQAAAPPSSRAAGKQPMAYVPANPATQQPNGTAPVRSARSAGKAPVTQAPAHTHNHNHAGHSHPQPAPAKTAAAQGSKPKAAAPAQPPRIWQTSTSEEREKIKEFWLELAQDDRQNLVKVEKDAVLKRMKEQQRHSCACAVCGRKRSAIEDELEVLYDAYYDELEAYAHHQAQYASTAGAIPPPLGPGPFPGSVEMDSAGHIIRPDHLAPVSRNDSRRKMDGVETEDEEDYDDEEYDDDDLVDDDEDAGSDEADNGDDDYEDSQDRVNGNRKAAAPAAGRKADKPVSKAHDGTNGSEGGDFFSFGSSLTTVKGILTVADDLLKNDGQKFMEMMEQLAERRMLREEAAIHAIEDDLDEEDEDEELDEDLDDEDEDDEEDDEDDRMEEGRRMFQIFAARMFEQRVLQSYREKVAQQKQLQFLRELEEEENAAEAKEARKAKDAQKKKDKKKLQKQAKEDEKAKKEAAAAAEIAAARAKREAAEKEAIKRREEERQRKEAEKRAKLEEAQKKEEEKRRKVAEEKEKAAELQRKQREKEERAKAEREAKERERKAKEEKERASKELKEKEEKEARERLVLEQEARREAARKEKEDREQRERDALVAAQAQAQAKLLSQQKAAAAKAAAIAQHQAKTQKTSRAPVTTPAAAKPKPTKVSTQPGVTVNGISPAVAPVAVGASAQVSPSPVKASASLLPTPNLKPASIRPSPIVASQMPSSSLPQQQQQQAVPQVGFSPMSGGQSVSPMYGSSRGGLSSAQSPPPHGSMQSPFPSQIAAFGAGRPSGVAANGIFPNMAYGHSSMGPSSGFTAAPGLTPVSPAPPRSSFTSEVPELNGRSAAGMGQLGLGHPGAKLGRLNEDMPFRSASSSTQPPFSASDMESSGHSGMHGRLEPIGPIQPIGRPRIPDVNDEAIVSASSSRRSSPPTVDRVLGSAALLADNDDEVIVPAPRRVSNAVGLGSSWGNPSSSLGNANSGGWGASPFGSTTSGIWGGSGAASNWQGSAFAAQPARGGGGGFDTKMAPGAGAIGGFPQQQGSRGFPPGSIGPPGSSAIRPPSS